MPSIDIRKPHQLSMQEAHAVVDQVAARMQEKLGVTGEWKGDTMHFSRTGVSGTIAVQADVIVVNVQLGLMMSPFKGMVEQEIQRKLDQHFS